MPLIKDQLDLSHDLLTRMVHAGITSARALSERSRGEVFCLLHLRHESQLLQIEVALKYRGLYLRTPEGHPLYETVGAMGTAGWRAAYTLNRRYRLQTLEELAFLGRKKIKFLYRIGPRSKALTAVDQAMENTDLEW